MLASTAPNEVEPTSPIPRGEKRRREIAAVAERVFFENGFADTTMQAIAARAGASKETLYRHFGSKEDLFAEIVASRARLFLENLDERFEQPGSVAEVLRQLGYRLLESILVEDAISLCRIVVAEASRSPELGEIFYAAGPDRVCERLAEFLVHACERGEVACDDPRLAANIFLGAVTSSFHLKRLTLENPPRLSPAEMHSHVDEVVSMFMSHYGA